MDETNYVMSVSFFLDRSSERLQKHNARVNLGPFVRPLTREEIENILYAAKIEYGRIIRRKGKVE